MQRELDIYVHRAIEDYPTISCKKTFSKTHYNETIKKKLKIKEFYKYPGEKKL